MWKSSDLIHIESHTGHAFNADIGSWDVAKVRDMQLMFYEATSFNQDLRRWAASPTLYYSIFASASAFDPVHTPPGVADWAELVNPSDEESDYSLEG